MGPARPCRTVALSGTHSHDRPYDQQCDADPREAREVGCYAPIDATTVHDPRGLDSEEPNPQQVSDGEGNDEERNPRGPAPFQRHAHGDQKEHREPGSLKAHEGEHCPRHQRSERRDACGHFVRVARRTHKALKDDVGVGSDIKAVSSAYHVSPAG